MLKLNVSSGGRVTGQLELPMPLDEMKRQLDTIRTQYQVKGALGIHTADCAVPSISWHLSHTILGSDSTLQKHNCPTEQIAEDEIHVAFLRVYHKLRLHGEPILKQMLDHLQTVRERRMLWSLEVIELNKRISDINDQDRMLADMNRCGLVDPDIFISRSNELAQQLRAAKQEKDRILGTEHDDTIPQTRELMELLETLPEFLPVFDGEIFADLVDEITADVNHTLRFRLKNGLELTESVERSMR